VKISPDLGGATASAGQRKENVLARLEQEEVLLDNDRGLPKKEGREAVFTCASKAVHCHEGNRTALIKGKHPARVREKGEKAHAPRSRCRGRASVLLPPSSGRKPERDTILRGRSFQGTFKKAYRC